MATTRRWRPSLPPAERELLAAGGGLYYDRDGEPITLGDWVEAFEDSGYRRVAFDQVGPYEVSTVWLGLDHGFGQGPPLIFETMVFRGDRSDLEQRRWSTEAEAPGGPCGVGGRGCAAGLSQRRGGLMGFSIEMVGVEQALLRDIPDPAFKRNAIALLYAFGLRNAFSGSEAIDWGRVNAAILERWSPAGLRYVKERAWKLYEGKIEP